MPPYQRGTSRERQVARELEKDGYAVTRSAGSRSPWDLVAVCKANRDAPVVSQTLFVQVKTDKRGAFANFGPAARKELLDAAHAVNAIPVLVHWPAGEKQRWYYQSEWP